MIFLALFVCFSVIQGFSTKERIKGGFNEQTSQEFVKAMEEYFEIQGNAIVEQATDEAFKYAGMKTKGHTVTKVGADDLVSAWFDMTVWDKLLVQTTRPFTRASLLVGGERAVQALGGDTPFDSTNAGVDAALERRAGEIVGVNRTTQKIVRRTIAEGIEAGEVGNDLRKRLRGVFFIEAEQNISVNRSKVIARTETIWAFNEGAVQGWQQSGVVEAKQWSVAQDDRLCPLCAPMEGKIVPLEGHFYELGEFDVTGGIQFEYENIDHPPLHPQCRCSLIPILIEV